MIRKSINSLNSSIINSLYHKLTLSFSEKVYQKINITRLPEERFTLYLDTNDTCENLFIHLNNMFPDTKFISTNSFENRLGQQISEKDNQIHSQMKNLSVIQILLNNNLMVYEEKNNKFTMCLGMRLSQLNITSNRNLPENIANNLIQLSEQWRVDRPIDMALNKTEDILPEIKKEIQQQRKQLIQQASNSYANYLSLYKFYRNGYIESVRTKRLGVNLVALMSFNWAFLFAVTYGKYGWDVGEPLSYLTNLGVDLIAMLGIFKAEQTLEEIGKRDFQKVSSIMNLDSQLKMREFQISYYKRKL